MTQDVDQHEISVQREKAKLSRSLNGFHTVFLILAASISMEVIGQVSSFGAETFAWIAVLAVLYLVPSALIITELACAYPLEGGLYVWLKRAYGKSTAGIGAALYLLGNPIWIGGLLTFTAAAAWSEWVTHLEPGSFGDYVFKIVFIWVAIGSSIVALSIGKWIPTLGAIARVLTLLLFSVALVIYAIQHGLHGFGLGSVAPTNLIAFLGLLPVLIFAYAGFEVPSSAAEEMTDAPIGMSRSIRTAALITVLAYCVPVFGIITVLPADDITGISGFLEGAATVFKVFGPAAPFMITLAAVTFVVGLATAGAGWNIGCSRVYASAALDGAAPRYFGVLGANGSPVRVNVASAVVATAMMVAAQFLAQGSAAATFTVVLYLATSTGIMMYLLILPAAWVLRRREPQVPRPYLVPGGTPGLATLVILTTVIVAVALYVSIFPGTLDQLLGYPFDIEQTFGVTRLRFELFTLGTFVVILVLAGLSYWIGRQSDGDAHVIAHDDAYAEPTLDNG